VRTIAVIGGGVAGCAAAVAAAERGARVVLVERSHHLGGAAARGEHRTLCGLAPIDAERPELLEPGLASAWVSEIASGAPFRQGRVWLWPTESRVLQDGLARRLRRAGVAPSFHRTVEGAEIVSGALRSLTLRGESLVVDAVVDASGSGAFADLLGLGRAAATQWSAYRAVIACGLASGLAARTRALATARAASGSEAALALTPLGDDRWQVSLDVPPGTAAAEASSCIERIAEALKAELLACAVQVADRDEGRPRGTLALDELFAERERGLCWAAWPREEHRPDGVVWTWPPRDRHGLPERATMAPGAPANCRFVGKGMPVSLEAAAALRVTGTCLALGAAVGEALALGG
jgi:2-polyprenyl-6-methoxyphenol hydroxylase-like FAD-dependent oxidoreductase